MNVEMYFDFSCPYAYIASTQIEAIAERANATVTWRPMLLGGVFRATSEIDSPMASMSPAKMRHNVLDMHRWAEHYGVELTMPAAHPMRTVRALRALLSVPEERWPPIIHELYRTYWQRGDDISSPDVIDAALERAGLDESMRSAARAANDDPSIKASLRERTREAVDRGVFGAPSMFVDGGLLLWGQDRLHFVEQALGLAPVPSAVDTPTPPRTIEFWYDFSSPFAYLGSTQIEQVAASAGANLVWRPMLLGAVFKTIGMANVPIEAMCEAKREYMYEDLDRWAAAWNVPFSFATRFPMKTVTALRLALLAGDKIGPLTGSLFRALWVDDGDLNDVDTLSSCLREHGFDADDMLARTGDPATKKMLIDNTTEAVERGVFGAPTSIVTDAERSSLFWGQDRLMLVERAAGGWRPSIDDQASR
jgi:2-hydroxychromene-2-carboxylate isomerase